MLKRKFDKPLKICAPRNWLCINALSIFKVVKTTTLISVKCLINSNLQVARAGQCR